MTSFICPVCKKTLIQSDKSLKCENGHCFDISRKGTVNLLLSNKSKHGDDKRMVDARKAFLDKGYYAPLLDRLIILVKKYAREWCTILDCGCGECYYTAGISRAVCNSETIGIDVSKEAINRGASRHAGLKLAAASVFDIPLANNSCDIVLAMFSPFSGSEYLRVLKDKSIYLTAFPLENHLFELKQAVYEAPYRNSVSPLEVDGFELIEYEECKFKAELNSNADITALFEMTPYCYKTSANDRAKLNKLDRFTVSAEFGIAVYRKINS